MQKQSRWGVVMAVAAATVALAFSGCGKAQQIAGIGDFSVDTSQNTLKASVELTFFKPNVSIDLPLPKMPNSFIELGPSPDGKGALLAIVAPFSSIIGAVDGTLPSRGLPDGRPLVGVSSSTLPSFDIQVQSLNLRFYLSSDVFGAFVPLPALPSFSSPIEVPIKDTRGYVVAYGIAVPPGAVAGSGGLLVFFPIDSNGNSGLISAH